MSIKGTAPGQYLGFALQPVRVFHHLLSCGPESFVGLEYADDVSVHEDGKALVLEQCKSALSHNPVSDWAVDFWKTLANWATNCADGHFDAAETDFRLYVTPTKKALLARKLSDAKSDAELDKLIQDVQTKRSKRRTTPACEQYLQSFLDTDISIRRSILRNFTLINCDDDPMEAIYDRLDAFVDTNLKIEICRWGIGKVQTLIDGKIRGGSDPLILASTFRKQVRAFISKHDVARVLTSLSDVPMASDVETVLSESPAFIRQLEIVNAATDTKTRAASDFLRASADRTRWAEEGLIFEESAQQYDQALVARHSNTKNQLAITHSDLPETDRGLLLYHRCCDLPSGKLDNRELPSHFLPGCLNSLADTLEIGWHPSYESILADTPES